MRKKTKGRERMYTTTNSGKLLKRWEYRGEGTQASGCLNRWGGEDTKRRRNRIRAVVEDPKTGTALNAGPTPYRAAGSLSSADGESTDTPVRCKPSVAGTRGVLPTHSDVCSAPPSPQQDWTELANLNKRSPPPACVRAEIRHGRDGKQKPNKQREPLQKGRVQQTKIPEGNTDYTGRGL